MTAVPELSVAPPGCEARALDLSDAGAVWRFAEQLEREERPLHVLVNCADDVSPFYQRESSVVSGGWETTAGRNHLGPFLLTQLMLDKVVATMKSDAKTSRSAARATRRYGRRGRKQLVECSVFSIEFHRF